jgi:hypothetical protein
MNDEKKIRVKDRLKICNDCKHYAHLGPHNSVLKEATSLCRMCGCLLAFKTRLEKSHCPIDKW